MMIHQLWSHVPVDVFVYEHGPSFVYFQFYGWCVMNYFLPQSRTSSFVLKTFIFFVLLFMFPVSNRTPGWHE